MSAFDPKRTSRVQCEMSAYGTQRSGAGFLFAEEWPMTIRLVKVLAVAITFGALVNLGAQTAMAKGGGSGHGGGGYGGGGKHFSGAGGKHFGGHVRGRSAHVGRGKIAHTRAHIRGGKSARVSHSKIGHFGGNHAHALGAAGALGGRAAWNQWGNPRWRSGWSGGWGGWSGPVFWPYFFGNVLAFTFWPYGYYAPFWGYGDVFVWDAMFWHERALRVKGLRNL